ncbi:MAG: tetratricopeptide repeat protein [Planctomycetota bacterium]|jgi:tetratricopeptide (TPR) repeat protein
MHNATLRKIVEAQLFSLRGDSFQDVCDRLCLNLYPDDYTPVRAGGPKGDTKMDGYCPKAKVYFAAHATRGERIRDTKRKIESDLVGCVKNHEDVQTWVYLTNDTLVGGVQKFVNEQLRTRYPKVTIETWDHKIIAEKMLAMKERDVASVLELDLGATVHLEAEIDNAVRLLNEDKHQDALVLLNRLWEQQSHAMTRHQKYRTRANIGHAYDGLGQRKEAAECFLEAKQFDPEHEKARAREALAYLYLGSRKKAYGLAKAFLRAFPENRLGRAVLVASAPHEIAFDKVEEMVPAHQRNYAEVAISLGEAAMCRAQYEIAQKYMSCALEEKADNPHIKEVLGELLLHRARIAEQAINDRGPTKQEIKYLQQAKELFSEALKDYQGQNVTASIVRTLLKRATVHMGLNDNSMMQDDVLFAYRLAPSDPEAVYRYASMKIKVQNWDGAITLLETLIGKGLRSSAELALSQCLDKRNVEGDKERAIGLLRSRLNDLGREDLSLRAEYLATLADLERQLEGVETAFKTLETLPEGTVSAELAAVVRGELLRLNGDHAGARDMADKVLAKIGPHTTAQDKRRIATFLQTVGMYEEALDIWKAIVEPEYIGRDTYLLMECAHQCEDVTFIAGFNEKLRSNGLWERKLFELELNYREKYHDDKGARKVMEEFLANPPDQSYAPCVRLRLSLLGIRTKKQDLIEKDSTKLPQVEEVNAQIGRWVAFVLRHGPEPIKGVEYAYELVRLNWNQQEAHIAMIHSILAPVGPKVEIKHPEEIVVPGVAVQYQENDTHELRWHVIENSCLGTPESSRNEFFSDHPISKKMHGKKQGECFYLVKDGIQERTATIKNVVSKYVYRFNDCLNEFENRFPGTHVIKRMVIKENGGKPDLSPLDRLIDIDAKYVEKIEETYDKNPVPIYTVANLKGRRIVEAIQYIISIPSVRFKCCKGTDEEEDIAEHALRESQNMVIDATALSTVFLMKSCEMLTKVPWRLVVSQGTIDDFRQLLHTYDKPQDMTLVYTKDGPISCSLEHIEEMRRDLQELIDLIEKCCIIESGLIIGGLETSRRNQLVQIFGQLGVESMMLAARAGHSLWTDDLITAEFARMEFGCQRVWTQEICGYLSSEGILEADFEAEMTMNLTHMRYYYTRPNVRSLLKAVDKTHGDVDKGPLLQTLEWFGDSNVNIEGVNYIGAMFLKSLWQSGHLENINQTVTIRVLERLSARPQGMNVIHFWLRNVHNIFGIDVVNAKKVGDVIQSWLSGGGRIIIP